MSFPLIPDEEARLYALKQLEILDTLPEASFDHLTALAARVFHVPIALVSFVDRERQWFKSRYGLDVCETSRDSSFCAHALTSPQVMVVPDATQDARFADNPLVLGKPGVRFYAGAPLRTPEGHVLGTFCLIDVVPRSFGEEDQELLRDMATLVMDELELRQSRDQLRTQEIYWRALIAGSSDIISVLDGQGKVQYESPTITPVLGYTVDELIGRTIFELIHTDDVARVATAFRAVVEDSTQEQVVEFRFRHQDGSWRDLEAIGKNCLADVGVKGIVVTSRDVTERKHMQERLRLLESVVIHANDTVIITDAENIDEPGPRIIYVNEAFTKVTGYSSEEAVGQSPRFLQGPLTQRPALDHLRDGLENHRPVVAQVINYRKDGGAFWAEMSLNPVMDESGQVLHWISIQRDITEAKTVEETLRLAHEETERINHALRRSEEQLQLALEVGQTGTWERDYDRNTAHWSPRTEILYGLKPGEFTGSFEMMMPLVHPEDREFIASRVKYQRNSAEFVDEFRVIWPDGSVHWLESQGRLMKDEYGHVRGTVGVITDITKRKVDLEAAQLDTLKRLALAAEYRDDETGLHTQRVGRLSRALAQAVGLPLHVVQLIGETAPLHDVGKIGIADDILLKPGKLTKEEFATMKRHTDIGAGILSGSTSPWLQMAEEIALFHHERWDGNGYSGLEGENIPLIGAIVCVADVFDALTHERPYKKAWSVEEAVAEIQAQSGRQFSPRVVEAFVTLAHDTFL